MKHSTKAAIALAVGGSLAGSLAFATLSVAAPGQRGPASGTPSVAAGSAVASDTLKQDLTFMREEERLARDVYTALAAKYDGAAPMANIKNSEQRHFDATGALLTRYGIADPSAGLPAGDYAMDELDAMYAELMALGNKSLADAYEVGVKIEVADIEDLEKVIARTSEADAKRVFENLLNGSENHLKAFEAAKAGQPVGQRDGAGMQNGRGRADGKGMRQGQGMGPGAGQRGGGQGMGPGTGNPADCPLNS